VEHGKKGGTVGNPWAAAVACPGGAVGFTVTSARVHVEDFGCGPCGLG
jgi:hypothetical protein